jgi:transcriptional regulator with XRE-family HTH domain
VAVTTLSPLGAARLRRRLTIEEAAARAGMGVGSVRALEENRMYRFGSNANALAAALVYATALGVSQREARELAGLPAAPDHGSSRRRRALAVVAAATCAAGLGWFVVMPQVAPADEAAARPPAARTAPALPERWEIQVDVYNGTGQGNAAAGVANRIAGLAYRIGTVENAKRHDYLQTLVYYPPGAEAIARRLAGELGVGVTALPGGDDPRRLIVIVGER